MRDGEWSILHTGGAAVFGLVDNTAMLDSFPELGDPEYTTDDHPRPRSDGVAFGTDTRSGRTITFELTVSRDTELAARQATDALGAVWRADAVRSTPGAVSELRTRQAGRERMTFGRPRRWAVNDAMAKFGVIKIICDFTTADDVWYDYTPESVVIDVAPGVREGFIAPIVSPLTTTQQSSRSERIIVGGHLNVWPVIELLGPITNPIIDIPGLWEMSLETSVPANEIVTIDTRPWSRGVRRGSANLSDAFGRSSIRLSRASIPPGDYIVYFRGKDPTGTARMGITWRKANTTL